MNIDNATKDTEAKPNWTLDLDKLPKSDRGDESLDGGPGFHPSMSWESLISKLTRRFEEWHWQHADLQSRISELEERFEDWEQRVGEVPDR
jgi:hypothetical protein